MRNHPGQIPENPIQDEDDLPDYEGQDLSDPDAEYDNRPIVEDCADFVAQCQRFIDIRNIPAAPNLFDEARKARELDISMAESMAFAEMMRARR